jgi:hypothetical protein
MAVGAIADNGTVGATWVFIRSPQLGTWQQSNGGVAPLVGTGNVGPGWQGIGLSLSADGNVLAVGGPLDNANMGAVWIFVQNQPGYFVQRGEKLTVSDNLVSPSYFGFALDVSADGYTMVVGGPGDNSDFGAIWVYVYTKADGGVWVEKNKLFASNATVASVVGYSVTLSSDGNTLGVGGIQDDSSTGACWVFT